MADTTSAGEAGDRAGALPPPARGRSGAGPGGTGAPGGGREGERAGGARRATGVPLLAAAAVLVAAALLALAPSAVLGYDALFHVLWGERLAAGALPDLGGPTPPTPHPLQLLLATLVAPLGDAAPDAFRVAHLLSAGVLAAALFEVGRRLRSAAVGVLAAALVAGSPYVVELAHRAAADVPALALVAVAGALEAGRRRRGAPVLALLALAGLLRPEAWLLAGAYALWCLPGRGAAGRAGLLALAAAPPVLWALTDLLLTGDALYSLHRTREITALIGRETGVRNALRLGPRHLDEVLGAAALVVAAGGAVIGMARARRATVGPLAVAAGGGAAFLVLAVAQLSLQPRYLLLSAAALAVLAGIGALGWTAADPADPWRRRWRAGGVAALVLLAAGAVERLDDARDVRARLTADDRSLARLLDRPQARVALARCPSVGVANAPMLPHVAQALDVAPGRVVLLPREGAAVAPTRTGATSVGGGVPGAPRAFVPPPASFRPVVANRHWELSVRGC